MLNENESNRAAENALEKRALNQKKRNIQALIAATKLWDNPTDEDNTILNLQLVELLEGLIVPLNLPEGFIKNRKAVEEMIADLVRVGVIYVATQIGRTGPLNLAPLISDLENTSAAGFRKRLVSGTVSKVFPAPKKAVQEALARRFDTEHVTEDNKENNDD